MVYEYWSDRQGRCRALGLDTAEKRDRAEYWPERLEKRRRVNNKMQYKVKWVGYPSTMEDERNETWDDGRYLPTDIKRQSLR